MTPTPHEAGRHGTFAVTREPNGIRIQRDGLHDEVLTLDQADFRARTLLQRSRYRGIDPRLAEDYRRNAEAIWRALR